jgi:hypothetical protein
MRAGNDWGLCDSENPTSLHVVRHLAYFRLLSDGEPPRGLANRSGLSRIYTMVHFVAPSVVTALHSKVASVISTELSKPRDLAPLRFGLAASITSCSVLDLRLFNIAWGHQRDWLTVRQVASIHGLLVATGSVRALDVTSRLSRTRVVVM